MAKKKVSRNADKPMAEVGIRPSRNKGREFIVRNSGRKEVSAVEVGDTVVDLGTSGATIYDETLANEIRDKYRLDPNVLVIEKPYVQLKDEGSPSVVFSVQLPDDYEPDGSNWVEYKPGKWRLQR
ncbi:hypothetical protein KQH61_05965 [bacterium]|nr:hypothetical protein [bacterium]